MATVSLKLKGLRGLRRIMRRYPQRVKESVQPALQKAAFELQANARTGAPVDTGGLVSSIQTDFRRLDELYARVFTALSYAAAQEYGFTDTVEVQAHTRTIEEAFGEPLDEPQVVSVSAHTRDMDIPGNYFMTLAAAYQKKSFSKEMGAAIRRARPS